MSVRGLFLGLVASATLIVPVASFARDADDTRSEQSVSRTDDAVRTLERLSDPRMQRDMGNVLSALVTSLMTMRVGNIANAVDDLDMQGADSRDGRRQDRQIRKMDPRTTIADLAGKGDPDFAENLDENVRAMPRMAGAMAGTIAQMLPMIDAMARDFEAQMDQNLRKAKSAR